jgi:glycosyl transferase family 87
VTATASPAVTRQRVVLAVSVVVGALGAWWALRPSWQVPAPTEGNLAEVRMQDFRDALYFPVREFLAGGDPYEPATMFAHWPVRQGFNLYQPYHLLLNLPFALPGYHVGAVAYTVVGLALLVLLSAMAASRLPVPLVVGTAVIAALLVLSQVGKAQLYLGQVNPLVAVGAAGALLVRNSHPRLAVLALAVAWLKPQFGLPLAILLLARGSRRVAVGGTVVAALASLPVVALLVARDGGVGSFLDTIRANLDNATNTDYGAVDSMTAQRVDVSAVVFRLTGWLVAEPLVLVVVLAVSVVLARRLDRAGNPAVADLLTCLAVVVAVVHQPGDVLIAVPAMALAAHLWWGGRREWWPVGVAVAALAVPFAHLYAVDVVVRSVLGERGSVTVDGVAVVVAWLATVFFAARFSAARRPT